MAEGQDLGVSGHGTTHCDCKIAVLLDVFLTIKRSEKRALSLVLFNWCCGEGRPINVARVCFRPDVMGEVG